MIALAIILVFVLLFAAVVYGRAIVYAHSEEYQLDERIRKFTRR
jgi:hypothetical protein